MVRCLAIVPVLHRGHLGTDSVKFKRSSDESFKGSVPGRRLKRSSHCSAAGICVVLIADNRSSIKLSGVGIPPLRC